MRRILFLDRDGTILVEPADNRQVDSVRKFSFLPGAVSTLGRIARELEFELVLVTNQDGLGTESFPRDKFEVCQQLMTKILQSEGVVFKDILIDESFPSQGLSTRKPGLGLVRPYLSGDFDIAHSFVVGDRLTDMEFARNMGAKGILLGGTSSFDGFVTAANWAEVYELLKGGDRLTQQVRRTIETSVSVTLNLDSSAAQICESGIPFLDHMILQIAKHGGIGLDLKAAGDLQVDEHHTLEDCAISLGEVLKSCLGRKKGIERYGFVLPMDESIASCTLDLSGRPFLKWDVEFSEASVGGITAGLFKHFFCSLSYSLGATLHLAASGENGHHIIEAVFKSFGRALKQALVRTGGGVPSSKGAL